MPGRARLLLGRTRNGGGINPRSTYPGAVPSASALRVTVLVPRFAIAPVGDAHVHLLLERARRQCSLCRVAPRSVTAQNSCSISAGFKEAALDQEFSNLLCRGLRTPRRGSGRVGYKSPESEHGHARPCAPRPQCRRSACHTRPGVSQLTRPSGRRESFHYGKVCFSTGSECLAASMWMSDDGAQPNKRDANS